MPAQSRPHSPSTMPVATNRAADGATFDIGIVADVRLYRDALAAAFNARPHFRISWTATSLDEAVRRLQDAACAAVVVDMATRDSMSIVRALHAAQPTLVIIAFAAEEDDQNVIACVQARVAGFVPAEGTIDDLTTAVILALRGEVSYSVRAVAAVFKRVALAVEDAGRFPASERSLTSRERAILDLIEYGLSNKEIAARLGIQLATVKNHVHNLLDKLHVASRNEAAALRRREGTRRR